MSISRIQFTVKVHNDDETRKKERFLSRLETALDHSLNNLPDDFISFQDNIRLGDKIIISMEIKQ